MKQRLHIFIYGKVQGVSFRYNTKKNAKQLGLKGWVKNLKDGSVEMLAEGEKEKLEGLKEWCKKGPTRAQVDYIDEEYSQYRGEFKTFKIRY